MKRSVKAGAGRSASPLLTALPAPEVAAVETTVADEGLDGAGADATGEEVGERRSATVGIEAHGQRLDRWLVALAPEFSRSHLQQLIATGLVCCDGLVQSSASRRVVAGQFVEIELRPTAQSTAFRPEPVPLDIVHEDEHLMVLNKPAGLVVHPAAGNWSGTLLNGLLAHHAGAALLPRAGIVHRLDKDTSGLMVVAKTLVAQTALVRAIAAHEVRREYLALAHGRHMLGTEAITQPIGRDPVSRIRMAVVASGKPARTDAQCLAVASVGVDTQVPGMSAPAAAIVSAWCCRLHTGRTHQIRVHLASIGHPLVGDPIYGGRTLLGLQRQALHAARLAFTHPVEGGWRVFSAALPPDLALAWRQVAGELGVADATIAENRRQ